MRALIQRVSRASVTADGQVAGRIGRGILLFLGINEADNENEIAYIADKVMTLRIFEDNNRKMNLSLLDIGGELLVISQFTLYGNCEKGRRPSFTDAARPERAEKLYEDFIGYIEKKYCINVERGIFAAMMDVELINSGPVTFMIESR